MEILPKICSLEWYTTLKNREYKQNQWDDGVQVQKCIQVQKLYREDIEKQNAKERAP